MLIYRIKNAELESLLNYSPHFASVATFEERNSKYDKENRGPRTCKKV